MRVLHVISDLDPRSGGPAVALAGMVAAQLSVGMQVSVVSSYGERDSLAPAAALRQLGARVEMVGPCRGRFSYHHSIPGVIKSTAADADLLHIHALWEDVQHRAAQYAREARVPYVITPHGMLDPWSLAQHWVRKQAYMIWRLRRNLNDAAALHFTSDTERDFVMPLGLKAPPIVEPNGLDLSEFQTLPAKGTFRAKHPEIGERPMVLFLSRLHYKKGLNLLVPAFAQGAPGDAMLVIAGPDAGGYKAQVEQMVADNNLQSRVLFTGMLHGAQRVEALADADLFVLPSYQENFGIAVAEALAASCPVIISDKVNIHDQITAHRVGAVVPTEIEPLAEQLKRWMGDPALRRETAARGRPFVWESYDWGKIASRWAEHYERLLAQSARATRRVVPSTVVAAPSEPAMLIPAVHSGSNGRPLRVLHVISDVDPSSGGPIVALMGLSKAQAACGVQVHVLATRHPSSKGNTTQYNDVFGASARVLGPTYGAMSRHPAIESTAAEMVAEADIVHIHAVWEEVQHQAARAAARFGVPYVMRPCGMLDPWSLAQHWVRKQAYMLWRLRRNLNEADALHFTSDTERDLVVPLNLKAPPIVEPNGLDLSEFQPLPLKGSFRRRHPTIGDRPLVLFLSRLHYKKGLNLLIPAFAQGAPKNAILAIAGPDADGYKHEVERMIADNGIRDRVLFTGMLHGAQRVEALADADLFALPSYQENFGIAVAEALAAGCPVLISDKVNIHAEITSHGVGGVVPTEIAPLAAELRRWMGDPALRAEAGRRARPFVWDSYDWGKIALRWTAHYRHIIEGHAIARAAAPAMAS